MTLLRSVSPRTDAGDHSSNGFPFSVPAIRMLERIEFTSPVTYFVGANGSGKSTLLEGIGAAARLPTVGSEGVDTDPTLSPQRALAKTLRLTWDRKTARGFFLRAEDFFGFTKSLARLRQELRGRLAEVDEQYKERSAYARGLAAGPAAGSLAELERRYGADLDANSHGESFLRVFQARFVPNGLYLLDEPEAALSPNSQLGFLSLVREMVAEGAQFIVATHSPILLAYPGARIYSFDSLPVTAVPFEELEHVSVTRDFLNDPQRYLRHLGF